MTDISTFQDFRTDKKKSTSVELLGWNNWNRTPVKQIEEIPIAEVEVIPSIIGESLIEEAVFEEIKPEISGDGIQSLECGVNPQPATSQALMIRETDIARFPNDDKSNGVGDENLHQSLSLFDHDKQVEEFKKS